MSSIIDYFCSTVSPDQSETPVLEDLPIRKGVIERVLSALNSWEISPRQVSDLIVEDPALTITILSEANKKKNAVVVDLEEAIRTFNRDRLMDLLQRSSNRSDEFPPDVLRALNGLRDNSCMTAKVARILAQKLVKEFQATAFSCGSLIYTGEILALLRDSSKFVFVSRSCTTRNELRQQLLNQLDIAVSKLEAPFLSSLKIPGIIHPPTPAGLAGASEQARLIAAVCLAAVELVEAFKSTQLKVWVTEKGASGTAALEHLLPDPAARKQILKTIYTELSGEVLEAQEENSSTPAEQQRSKKPQKIMPAMKSVPPPTPGMKGTTVEYDVEASTPVMIVSPDGTSQILSIAPPELPEMAERSVNRILNSVFTIIERQSDTNTLLTQVMDQLVEEVFKRCALIEIADDARVAFAITIRGADEVSANDIEFSSPLSPLSRKSTTVQSFATDPKDCSPFGSKAFALAPLDAKHSRPVALYADCGQDVILNLGARSIFRSVIEKLNAKLPETTGSLSFLEPENA